MKIAIFVLCLIGSVLAKKRQDPKPRQAPRIVNGRDAEISNFPFMVSIRILDQHACGGTLLNEEWILTAAHCMVFDGVDIPIKAFSAQFGNTAISPAGSNVVKIAKLIPHDGYKAGEYIHDIGLIKLAKPISNPPEGFRAKLPLYGSNVLTGSPAIAAGWGINETGVEETQTILQAVDVFAISAYKCEKIYDEIDKLLLAEANVTAGIPIEETNICSSFIKDLDKEEELNESDMKGVCSGDSGGPILIDGVQVGITSFGFAQCAILPDAFTAVSFYVKWIAEKTGINLEPNTFLRSEAKLDAARRVKNSKKSPIKKAKMGKSGKSKKKGPKPENFKKRHNLSMGAKKWELIKKKL